MDRITKVAVRGICIATRNLVFGPFTSRRLAHTGGRRPPRCARDEWDSPHQLSRRQGSACTGRCCSIDEGACSCVAGFALMRMAKHG